MLNNILKISFIVFFIGCADDSVSSNGSTNTNSNNLNIITWNIERYPKHEDTNDNLIEIIENLDKKYLKKKNKDNERVVPAETRLTVYCRRNIFKNFKNDA